MVSNVFCSVLYKYAGGGQGTTAAGTFGEAVRAGLVRRLFTWSYVEGTVSPEIVSVCPFRFVTKTSYRMFKYVPILNKLPKGLRWLIDDNVFDLWVASQIRAFEGYIDIFHGWHHQCFFSMQAAREKGAKLVMEQVNAHPAHFAEALPRKSNVYVDSVIRKAEREYGLADRIVVPSQFVVDTFLRQGIDRSKLALFPYGVDSTKYSPGETKAQTDFSVLFVGSVTHRKGIATLVQAFSDAHVTHSRLDVVGPIENDMTPLMQALSNHPAIRFHGQCDPLPFYRNASVFAFPSLIEGSALVCYEAAACGLPVIATYESGSIIRDGIEGFIIPKDNSQALAEKIQLLARDESLRSKMSINARARAEQFSWKRRGQAIIQLYKELVLSST